MHETKVCSIIDHIFFCVFFNGLLFQILLIEQNHNIVLIVFLTKLPHQRKIITNHQVASNERLLPNTDNQTNFDIIIFHIIGESPKTPIPGQRRIFVRNADGTTRIISQGTQATPSTPKTPGETSTQKVQIIRGSDGKVSVRGLNPGQQLIQMPDGKLHVLTSTSTGQKAGPAIQRVGGNPKVITKLLNQQQPSGGNASPTAQKVVLRPQVPQKTMVLKTAVQKGTSQRLLVGGTQVVSSPTQKLQVATPNSTQKIITSKAQLVAAPQKVVQTSNLQQILTQAPAGQKILINQATGAKQLIVTSQQPVVSTQQTIIQTSAGSQPAQQIIFNQPQQKVVQQYVNSTNQQQQITIGNQRILLNPGQRIIAQQQPQTQSQPQVVQQVS